MIRDLVGNAIDPKLAIILSEKFLQRGRGTEGGWSESESRHQYNFEIIF